MSESSRPRTIAGMPAFNEGKYLGSLIVQIKQYVDEVVVVDDGSTDNTAKVAELAGATIVRHGTNKGYGSAIRSIMAAAREKNADILVILDADSQHNPDEIPALANAISAGADLVIGSRELKENKIAAYRHLGQKVLAAMTHIASGSKLSDTESGFRAYSKKALATLQLKETGMAISSEIASEAFARGLKVVELPISVTYTENSSTMNPIAHGLGVFNRILVMISERKPLLFFGIVGSMLIIAGIIIGVLVVQVLYARQVLATGSALISMMLITIGIFSISTGLILSVLIKRIENHK